MGMLFISNSYALDIGMKKVYAPGETIIAEVYGPIVIPISAENVQFRRGENIAVPLEYDLKKIDERYFLWAISPETVGNYTVIIKDVRALEQGKDIRTDFLYNFSVEGNITEYSVKPGVIITSKEIELKAYLNRNYGQRILIGENNKTFFLEPGENKITLSLDELKQNNGRLRFGFYSLPLKIIDQSREADYQKGLSFSPAVIRQQIDKDINKLNFQITVLNSQETKLENLSFVYDKTKFMISPDENFRLAVNESKAHNLTLFNLTKFEEYEEIYAVSGDSKARLLLNIEFIKENSSINLMNNNTSAANGSAAGYRCSEIRGGRFCNSNEKCSGEIVKSLDGDCCAGTCTSLGKTQSSSWIGYLLVILLLGIVGYIYYNYSKTKKNNGDSFKKKVDEAEKNLP